jgi:hypothetical protein
VQSQGEWLSEVSINSSTDGIKVRRVILENGSSVANIGFGNGKMYLGQSLSVDTADKTFFTSGKINVNHKATIDSGSGDIFTSGKINVNHKANIEPTRGDIFTNGKVNIANKVKINDSGAGNIEITNSNSGLVTGNIMLTRWASNGFLIERKDNGDDQLKLNLTDGNL